MRELRSYRWADVVRLTLLVVVAVCPLACGASDRGAPPDPQAGQSAAAVSSDVAWQSAATDSSFTISWDFSRNFAGAQYVEAYIDGAATPSIVCGSVSAPYGLCAIANATFAGYAACARHEVRLRPCVASCSWNDYDEVWECSTECLPAGAAVQASTVGAATSVSPTPLAKAPTDFAAANHWLFDGGSAPQRANDGAPLDPSTFPDDALAVIRGSIKTRDGDPVVCGRLSIVDHPEYGSATTWWDGSFALAVKGTGPVLVDVQGPAGTSYLPIQRRVVPRVHDYTWMDDARLTPITGSATLINSSNRFVLGPDVTPPGETGPRRLAAFFPAGTQATVDGMSPIDTFSVRAIEYTVGAGGPAAMPGLLPPSSGYTFAAAFALDGHERKTVRFSGPVVLYVDNWAGVGVDVQVPNGKYDEKLGVWVPELPEHNGRVIAITGVDSSGQATVSGGVTLLPGEATELARYWTGSADAGTGHTLWRFEVEHFSSFDWNFAIRAIAGALPPGLISFFSGDTTKPSCRAGSIIECENQTLGEVLPIAGTPFSLRYSSARQPGRWREFVASVEKPSSPLPKRVEGTATIAGRLLTGVVSEAVISDPVKGPRTYYQFRFRWDGRDSFARVLNGRQRAHVKVGFVYDGSYFSVTKFGDPAAMSPDPAISFIADSTRKEATLYRELDAWVDTWVDSIQGLGGWSLSPVHYYDVESQTLYRGDGGVVHTEVKDASIFTVAGGASGTLTTGALARSVALPYELEALAMAPDRSLYVATFYDGIWKITPDATNPSDGFENARIHQVLANDARGLAVDGAGRLYFTPISEYRLYRYDSASGLVQIAGSPDGTKGIGGDGPAMGSEVSTPRDITVLPDGTIYFVDDAAGGDDRIRRIAPGPKPLVRTVAGGGSATDSGSKATELKLTNVGGVAARANGDLFIATQNQIWRVGPDGYANKTFGSDPPVSFRRIAISPDGTVFVSTMASDCRVYRLEGDKLLRVVAGVGGTLTCPPTEILDGGRAADAKLHDPTAIAIDSRGDLFVVNLGDSAANPTHRVLRVSHGMSSLLVGSERFVASGDASEVYVFDTKGVIQRTVDAFTGRAKLTFNHDPVDRTKLTSIVDAGDNTLTINRVSASSIELRSQDNLVSKLTLTGDYLTRFDEPEVGRSSSFTYSPNGLLWEYRDPIANATSGPGYQFAYDSNGRLSHDYHAMASGTPQTLVRTTDPLGWRVDVSSGAGQQISYDLRTDGSGNLVRTRTLGTGMWAEVTRTEEDFAGRSRATTYASNATMTTKLSSDPRFGHVASYASQLDFKPSPSSPIVSTTIARSVSPSNASAPGTASNLTETVSWLEGSSARSMTTTTEKIGTSGTRVTTARPSGATTAVEYDLKDRLVRVVAAGHHELWLGYDARGRITAIQQGVCPSLTTPDHPAADCSSAPPPVPAGCRRVSFGYDATTGYLACAFDPLGLLGRITTDKVGRPRTVTTPYGSSERTVTLTHVADGTTMVVVPVQATGGTTSALHTFTLDRSSGKLAYNAPTVGSEPTSISAALGADLELRELTRSEPWAKDTWTFSPVMRPQTRSFGSSDGGTGSFMDYMTWGPDGLPGIQGRLRGGSWQAYSWHQFDGVVPTQTEAHLTPSSGATIDPTVSRTFDGRLRLDTQSVYVAGNTSTVSYGYDLDGLLKTATVAGQTLTVDRLLTGGIPRPDGAPTAVSVAGTRENLSWSLFGELAGARDASSVSEWGLEATRSGTRYLGFTYERDARGRITRLTEYVAAVPGLAERTQTTSYTYRHDGALEGVIVNAGLNEGPGSVVATRNYSYDINGNRDVPVGGGTGNTYDAQDRLVSDPANTFVHDRDGRLVRNWWNDFSHTYDADGQLIGWRTLDWSTWVERTVTYRYDALGRRVLREESGVSGSIAYVYEDGGLLPIAEYRGGTLVSRFVFASRPNVPDLVLQGGKVYRIFADHLGSPRVVVDTATGAVVQRTDYNEWGVVVGEYVAPGFAPVPFGFAGGLYDRTTKYVHFGAREYDPARGRWLTKEPMGFAGGATNFYAYAGNDPVNRLDPTGLYSVYAWGAASKHVGPEALGLEGELVGLAGYDSVNGAFAGGIAAAGVVGGLKGVGEAALYAGYEGLYERDVRGDGKWHLETAKIRLLESTVEVGPIGLVFGRFDLPRAFGGKVGHETGTYFGISFGHWSGGFGFSDDDGFSEYIACK
ncbi:MAG: hypothetical protein HYV09_11795 [Deltaproteobacteria bacterium]|nr:hypothetical protein [Deltaproteobacteria bacterium]